MHQYLDWLKQNKILAAVIGLSTIGLALYANTLGNQMFWDDFDFILNNQYVRDWRYIPQYFSENIIAGANLVSNYWRPVLLLVFSMEYHIWGANPVGYHLVNMLFHIANALLLFFLLNNLFKSYKLSLLASLLFLIHPLQTESVSYANSLGDSLSVFFMLLGLNNYLHFRHNGDKSGGWWSTACFALALMSKETAIIYPGLVALLEFFHRFEASFKERLRALFKHLWPSVLTAAVYILLRATVLNFQNSFNLYNEQNVFTESILIRIFTFFKILATYLGLLFYPHDLHMERSISLGQSFFEPQVLLGFGIFSVMILAVIWFWKRHPAVSFGFLWFLFGLAPTSNIAVPINGLLYEHWLYLPMIGFWLAMLAGTYAVRSDFLGNSKRLNSLAIGILVLYCSFLSFKTIVRNREWRDPITFYNQTLRYSPDSYRVINNLGMAYADAGDSLQAKQMYERAIELDPTVQVAYHNLANAYAELGDTEQAAQNYLKAIELDPKFFYSYNSLTKLYLDQNNYAKAREVQEKFLPYSPNPEETKLLIEQIRKLEK